MTTIRRRVLLVEDSPSDAGLITAHIAEQTRWEAAVANSRREAVQTLDRTAFDAVLLDLGLPDAQGLDIIRDLRDRFDVPIIVLTSRPETTWGSEVLRAGAQDFIAKEELAGSTLSRVLQYACQRHAHRQQLERAQRRLQRYARAVAHDVRAPLATIRGFSELITVEERSSGRSGGRTDDYARRISQQAVVLQQLVADLLEDSSTDGADSTVDMTAAARWVEDLVGERLDGMGAQMTITRLPRLVGNRMVLRQVMLNLTSNALDHAVADPLHLRWSSWRREDGGWDLMLVDNGDSVDPELVRNGQPLPVVPIDLTADGHGIGLRVAAAGMAEHNGTIWLSTSPTEGLCVTLAFPVEASVDAV